MVRTLFVTVVSLTSLSACVSADPQARLRAGSGASLASTFPIASDSVEAVQPLVGLMPGDLLSEPKSNFAGINPQTVLTHSNKHIAEATSILPWRGKVNAAHITNEPEPMRTEGPNALVRTSALFVTPSSPTGSSTSMPSAERPVLTPADVETRAEIEQRAQESRNQRFDLQVRRASSSVCSGCISTTRRKPDRLKSPINETE